MVARERSVKTNIKRKSADTARRRITKYDGKFAAAAAIKSSPGVVVPAVRKVLLDRKRQEAERSAHRTSVIFPSEMARTDWCPRSTYYRMSGFPDPKSSTSFTLENIFAEGNTIHSKWQGWLAETGLLWGDWRCSRCSAYVKDSLRPEERLSVYGPCVGVDYVDLNYRITLDATKLFPHNWKYKEVTLRSTSLPISGHADGALVKHNCLIEIKSVGIGTLRFEAPSLIEENTKLTVDGSKVLDVDGLWSSLHRPLASHVRQGNVYLWMAKEMGLPFDSIVFLYEFKANQRVKEFQVKMSDTILDPVLDLASKVGYALGKGTPPSCPYGGCASCRAYEVKGGKDEVHTEGLLLP